MEPAGTTEEAVMPTEDKEVATEVAAAEEAGLADGPASGPPTDPIRGSTN